MAGQRIPGGATPELFHAVGELLALYAGGTTELLRTIGEIKNTFRINQTQIQQTDNNPLRWAVSPKEAVRRLLSPEEAGYLTPREAVMDAIASIKAHQIGSIRGMEAAFKQFLSEQDPAELERGFERQGRPGPLTNRGAWCWQQYAAYHRRLSENAQENVLDLLGDAFCSAYEQQVRRIRGQHG
jgi:type VI secretion system FHA domain protein